MDKCGHHNNRHYYFAVKIAIIILFLIFVIIIQTRKGLKTIFVLFAGAMVMTTPGMESSSLTREELIIMYFFKALPYLTACVRGKEGSGQMLGLRTGQGWNVRKGVRMQL